MTPLQIYLPSGLKEWLRSYAERHDLTMTTVIKIILERERATDKAATNGKSLYETISSQR